MGENMQDLLLREQFRNLVDSMKERAVTVDKKLDDLEKRVKATEDSNLKTDIQYANIMGTLNKLSDVTIPSLAEQVQQLKNKPGERYNLIITTGISAIVGAVIGYIVNMFI